MTLDLFTITLFVGFAVVYSAILPPRWRQWTLLIASLIAIYSLQPRLALRFTDYILPTLTVALAVIGWFITRKADDEQQQASYPQDRITLIVTALMVIAMSGFRYIDPDFRLTASRPPNPLWIVLGLGVVGMVLMVITRLRQRSALPVIGMGVIVAAFVMLKTEPIATAISAWGRSLSGQNIALASPLDLNWLGFSYVAFRLIHTLRDRQTGLLPALSLRDYLTYVIFFPAYIAGPIDRAERFQKDMAALPERERWDGERWLNGISRIASGLFKKFVIADSLALGLALNPVNAAQTEATVWLWVLLYGYALRLFFDFAGYSDIAIGIGILFGVKLPENFNAPYLKTDITTFWKSWHMTLSDWARFYVFTPLSRGLLRRKPKPPTLVIVLIAHLATMITIGLWHGITINFLIWGIWHAAGLFVHKVWTDRTRKWERELSKRAGRYRVYRGTAWVITVQFVVLGWVWFALPTVSQSLDVFRCLMGACG